MCSEPRESKRLKKLVASESVRWSTEHMLHIYIYTYMHTTRRSILSTCRQFAHFLGKYRHQVTTSMNVCHSTFHFEKMGREPGCFERE